jgi:hypothetical protein
VRSSSIRPRPGAQRPTGNFAQRLELVPPNEAHPAFEATIAKVLHSDQWCPACWQERRQPPNPQVELETVAALVRERGGEIFLTIYRTRTPAARLELSMRSRLKKCFSTTQSSGRGVATGLVTLDPPLSLGNFALRFCKAVLEMLDRRGLYVHARASRAPALAKLDPVPVEKLEMRLHLVNPLPQVVDEPLAVCVHKKRSPVVRVPVMPDARGDRQRKPVDRPERTASNCGPMVACGAIQLSDHCRHTDA